MDTLEKLFILSFEDNMSVAYSKGMDRREIPIYSVPEAALYLHVQEKTLRNWLYGRSYQTKEGPKYSEPLIAPADGPGYRLSFFNLVEAHILKSTLWIDNVPMSAIRDALAWAIPEATPHPLISRFFRTEGSALFEKRLGEIVNASKYGQLAFPDVEPFLERIDRHSVDYPTVLYPFIPNKPESKVVVIKPGVSSGVPTIAGTGISVPVVFGRYQAGDSIEDLADDYGLKTEEVEDAIAFLDEAA
jgi:uncharacterized protein (DUF433 family)